MVRWLLAISFLSASVLAHGNTKERHDQISQFSVTPLNSPVKGSVAKFRLGLPIGFEIEKVKIKLVNSFDLKKEQKKFNDISVVDNFELNVGVSSLPPGFYQLYVKVIDKKTKREHDFKTKHHGFVRFVIDETLQVPVPDPKKNNETIAGIDSDNDGIRDDIQRWINEEYSNQPRVNLGVKQLARSMQADILNAGNKDNSIIMGRKMLDSAHCLKSIVGFDKEPKIYNKIKSKLLNTQERLLLEIKANANFSGQGYLGPQTDEEESETCDFN